MSKKSKSVQLEPIAGEDPKTVEVLQKETNKIYDELYERGRIFPDPEENTFFVKRLRAYLKDFVGLNASSDLDVLFNMLVEAIQQQRILKSCQDTGRPLPEAYTESHTRWQKLMSSLSVRRIDRKKIPDKEEDIRQIFTEIFAANSEALADQDKAFEEAEKKFMETKKVRDESLGLQNA